MSLEGFLVVSAILFSIGLYGSLAKRNAITVLMSLELMFNAVNLALVAVSRYVTPAVLRGPGSAGAGDAGALLAGQGLAIFVIVAAAAEVALGLALVIALVRRTDSLDVTRISLMRR